MSTHDEKRLDAILDDARAGRLTPEAAFDVINADPALYKALGLRMIHDVLRRPGGDKVLTDAYLLKRGFK
jgi:hypothetical protein